MCYRGELTGGGMCQYEHLSAIYKSYCRWKVGSVITLCCRPRHRLRYRCGLQAAQEAASKTHESCRGWRRVTDRMPLCLACAALEIPMTCHAMARFPVACLPNTSCLLHTPAPSGQPRRTAGDPRGSSLTHEVLQQKGNTV